MQIPVNSSGIRVEMTTRQTDQDLQLVDPSAGSLSADSTAMHGLAGPVGNTTADCLF